MNNLLKIWHFLRTYKFALLFISLLLQIILPVFFRDLVLRIAVTYLCVSLTLLVSIILFYKKGHTRIFFIILSLVLVVICINWFNYIEENSPIVEIARVLFLALFYPIILINIFKEFKRRDKVNVDFIFGATSGFLLIGIIGAFLAFIVNYFYPGSFSFGADANNFREFSYFSFVTLTTLGYGDYLPVSEQGEIVSVIIAIAGQLYLTITMALIIGLYLMHRSK